MTADAIQSWKDFHAELAGVLGLDICESRAALADVEKLQAEHQALQQKLAEATEALEECAQRASRTAAWRSPSPDDIADIADPAREFLEALQHEEAGRERPDS